MRCQAKTLCGDQCSQKGSILGFCVKHFLKERDKEDSIILQVDNSNKEKQ